MKPQAAPLRDSGIRSIAEILRKSLQQFLQEELSPLVREQVASTLREELGHRANPVGGGLLTVQDVAQHCGVTEPTVRAWIKSGQLSAVSPGMGRLYRVRREDLDAYLERHPPQGGGVAPGIDDQVARILDQVRVRGIGEKK